MATIKAQSVQDALRKGMAKSNRFVKQYGEMLWLCALLTAYQGGGYEELKYNYEHVPLKFINLLIEAYKYKNTELELIVAQAASRPYMKKQDGQKYIDDLVKKLEGKI